MACRDGMCGGCEVCFPLEAEQDVCGRCEGEGMILVCLDDSCRGAGECIHDDGYIMCPDCEGSGDTPETP